MSTADKLLYQSEIDIQRSRDIQDDAHLNAASGAPDWLIDDIKETARQEAVESKTLLSDVISELPHTEDGDDIISAILKVLLTENLTNEKIKTLRMSMAIELEAMTERHLERNENHQLKIRGIEC